MLCMYVCIYIYIYMYILTCKVPTQKGTAVPTSLEKRPILVICFHKVRVHVYLRFHVSRFPFRLTLSPFSLGFLYFRGRSSWRSLGWKCGEIQRPLRGLCKLCSPKQYWEVLCASLVSFDVERLLFRCQCTIFRLEIFHQQVAPVAGWKIKRKPETQNRMCSSINSCIYEGFLK